MPKPLSTQTRVHPNPDQSCQASQTKGPLMDTPQKYKLARNEAATIRLSLGAVITCVTVQSGHLWMWVCEPVDALARKPRVFVALPTWQSLSQPYVHIGTCDDGAHVWHVLEVL